MILVMKYDDDKKCAYFLNLAAAVKEEKVKCGSNRWGGLVGVWEEFWLALHLAAGWPLVVNSRKYFLFAIGNYQQNGGLAAAD